MARIPLADIEGNSMERAQGHCPELASEWMRLDAFMRFQGTLSPKLKEEVRRSLAPGVGCVFCASLGDPAPEHPDPKEALAIAYAQMILENHREIDDSTFDVLKEEFSTEQIVELTSWILFMIASQAFGAIMKVEPASGDELAAYQQWRRDGEAAAQIGADASA
jgi:alkylhydroperoxidase family enzyme